jgi:hypothetical protein
MQFDDENREIRNVPLSELQAGPVRHDSFDADASAAMKWTYHEVGHYLHLTLEQWELGFMRDANYRSEVALWCRIAIAMRLYRKRYPKETYGAAREISLVGSLAAISTGVTDHEQLKLDAKTAHQLVRCYSECTPADADGAPIITE